MIRWQNQGEAIVGALSLVDGRKGKAVVVGARENPKGASLVIAAAGGGEPERVPLADATDLISPEALIDILCTQERAFGSAGLEPPKIEES